MCSVSRAALLFSGEIKVQIRPSSERDWMADENSLLDNIVVAPIAQRRCQLKIRLNLCKLLSSQQFGKLFTASPKYIYVYVYVLAAAKTPAKHELLTHTVNILL